MEYRYQSFCPVVHGPEYPITANSNFYENKIREYIRM
jgi:hypothetical protein